MRLPHSLYLLALLALLAVSSCIASGPENTATNEATVKAIPLDVAMTFREKVITIARGIDFVRRTENGFTTLSINPTSPSNDPADLAALRNRLALVDESNVQTWRVVYGREVGTEVIAGRGIFVNVPRWPTNPGPADEMRLVIREENAVNSLSELVQSGRGLFSFTGFTAKDSETTKMTALVSGELVATREIDFEPKLDVGFAVEDGKLTRASLKIGGSGVIKTVIESYDAAIKFAYAKDKYRLWKGDKKLSEVTRPFFAQYGVVPVFGNVGVEIGIGWEIGGSGKLNRSKLTYEATGAIELTAECTDAGCETKIPLSAALTRTLTGDADDKATLSVSAFLYVRAKLSLYYLAGPGLSLNAPYARVAAVYRSRDWSLGTSLGGQVKADFTVLGTLGASWEGPLCNVLENNERVWRCYGTTPEADDALAGYAGALGRPLFFPALFDGAPLSAVNRRARDRLETVISLYNPGAQTALVIANATDAAGSLLSRGEITIRPQQTVELTSLGPLRGAGGLFDGNTRGKKIAVELIPDERIVATALLMRTRDDGQPLGGRADRPAQVTTVNAIDGATLTRDVVFAQLPSTGEPAPWNSYDSEAYVTNLSSERVNVEVIVRCTGLTWTQRIDLRARETLTVRPSDYRKAYDQCALHVRTNDAARLAGSTVWANPGEVADSSALVSFNGASEGATAFLPARVQWNRSGFQSGISLQNVGDRSTKFDLVFSFPNRARTEDRQFTISGELGSGESFRHYMGVEQIAGIRGPNNATEPPWAGDGIVTVRTSELGGPAQPLVVNVNADNRVVGGAWSLLPTPTSGTATALHVPAVYNQYAPSWLAQVAGPRAVLTSGITLTNPSDVEWNRCVLTYLIANQIRLVETELEPRGVFNQFLPTPKNGVVLPTGVGSVSVKCERPVAGEVSMRMSDSASLGTWLAGDACSATNAFIER